MTVKRSLLIVAIVGTVGGLLIGGCVIALDYFYPIHAQTQEILW